MCMNLFSLNVHQPINTKIHILANLKVTDVSLCVQSCESVCLHACLCILTISCNADVKNIVEVFPIRFRLIRLKVIKDS